jgi:predicted trehalose synthase
MALDRLMREAVDRIERAFREYAQDRHWSPDDYRVFVRLNQDWAQVHVVLVAKSYGGSDLDAEWERVMSFLDTRLSDLLDHLTSLNLTLRTFSQLEDGGIYRLGPDFVEVHDLLASGPIG